MSRFLWFTVYNCLKVILIFQDIFFRSAFTVNPNSVHSCDAI